MIPIKKNEEPAALARLRERNADKGLTQRQLYAKLTGKTKYTVRDSLLKEQGHLCAYCMCSIPREDVPEGIPPTVIEHYIPRDPEDGRDVGQGLDYNNLLVVCHGNKARRGTKNLRDLTCDAHRGNLEFRKLNPLKPETLRTIEYSTTGTIFSEDEDVNYDLNVLLNLNAHRSPIKGERRAALEELIAELGVLQPEVLEEVCQDYLDSFESENDPKTPYQGILIWYLRSFITET